MKGLKTSQNVGSAFIQVGSCRLTSFHSPSPDWLEIHPQVFAMGTANKPYQSLIVDTSQYTGSVDLDPLTQHDKNNLIRAKDQPYLYLLNKSIPGPLICKRRGKLLVLAAGQVCPKTNLDYSPTLLISNLIKHAVLINFGLEAHVMGMPPSLYEQIISNSVPGPNPDPEKAELIRQFVLPESTRTKGSSPVPRYVNIFIAFRSETWVWALCDFARLVRTYVVSRDQLWKGSDFEDGSLVCHAQ